MLAGTTSIKPRIHPSWKAILAGEFQKPYFHKLKAFLLQEKAAGAVIYPPGNKIFFAFDNCPFEQVKVVILGQDPYHGAGQAHGLCFSVPPGIRQPPSLQNIFKELKADLGFDPPRHGCLEKWAHQGVLLLNASLTVRASKAGSHFNQGWEPFTDAVIQSVSRHREHVVFILWGRFAMNKKELIDVTKHTVLTAPHPSPFSADRGFFGCRHFSKTNQDLQSHGLDPVDWNLNTA